jgi:hypothetical protein
VTVLPLNDDYTARDFAALETRLQRNIETVFPAWTDFNQANFGVILLQLQAYTGDVLDVYGALRRREEFLSLCTQRPSARRHTRLLGYTMRGATAAQVDLQFTLSQTYPGDVTFPAGSVVRSESATAPVRVQLLNDLTILAGNLTGTVTAENATTPPADIFQSDGSPDQEYELTQTPYLTKKTFTAPNGTYEVVDSFLDSLETDRHCIVLISEEERALVRFGDGRNGQPPSAGEAELLYTVGGGAIIIDPGTLKVAEFSARDSLDNAVVFSVTNPLRSSGGQGPETIAEARINAPASIRVGDRSVAREDYEINALRIAGLARALMLTSDQYAPIAENFGQLHLVALGAQTSTGYYGPATPTTTQLEQVKATILSDYPPTVTFDFDALAGTLKTIDIIARVWLESGADPATVDAAIRLAYEEYFAVANPDGTPTTSIDFGYNIKDELGQPEPLVSWGDLFAVVKTTPGVRRVDEDNFIPTDAVTLLVYELPRLGTVTLINARTGLPLV